MIPLVHNLKNAARVGRSAIIGGGVFTPYELGQAADAFVGLHDALAGLLDACAYTTSGTDAKQRAHAALVAARGE